MFLSGCSTPLLSIKINFGQGSFSLPCMKAFSNESNISKTAIRDPTEFVIAEKIKEVGKSKPALLSKPNTDDENLENRANDRLAELQAKQRTALERLKQ